MVLPFVPVTATHFAIFCVLSLRCHARSMSVIKGLPSSPSLTTKGCLGSKPGETTAKSNSPTLASTSGLSSAMNFDPITSSNSTSFGSASRPTTVVLTASSTNVSATLKPLFPNPKTKAERFDQSACQELGRLIIRKSTRHRTNQLRPQHTALQ